MVLGDFWRAKDALMQKPGGDATRYCGSCHGEGCGTCQGWGWEAVPDFCRLPATGKPCGDCADRKGCQR